MRIGYALLCEEHGPDTLVRNARLAEEVGFDYLSISDHFHPWSLEQGESPFAWTVIGALRAVTSLPVVTQVTCPFLRYHPAVVAQAAATAAAMGDAPFVLGVGTGEALNENVVGRRWPSPRVRLEMLAEAIEVIRALWTGEPLTYEGRHVIVDRATLHTLPATPPQLAVAAGGDRAIELAATHGHLVLTAPDAGAIGAYRDAGGSGEAFGQTMVCYAPRREEAAEILLRGWRTSPLGWSVKAELPTPGAFDDATSLLPDAAVLGDTPLGPDVERIVADLDAYRDAGFAAVSVHNVGPHQEGLLRALGPALRG